VPFELRIELHLLQCTFGGLFDGSFCKLLLSSLLKGLRQNVELVRFWCAGRRCLRDYCCMADRRRSETESSPRVERAARVVQHCDGGIFPVFAAHFYFTMANACI
jgi:hypothetical protein